MRTQAAVLSEMRKPRPYAESRPLVIEDLELDGPGPGEVLVGIEPTVPLDKAALFGCAVLTGVGAVTSSAKAQPGQSLAVFGLGGVGLSALLGAKLADASPIIGVDPLPAKLDLARKLGAH